MSTPRFDNFFQVATGKPAPYDYQCRLACGERNGRPEAQWLANNVLGTSCPQIKHRNDLPEAEWLTNGTECKSRLINIPTGLGKTAAVVLAWLWNRAHRQNLDWARRLVYCLPMRTLVEQTRDEVQRWVAALHKDNFLHDKPPKVIILMGGEELEGEAKDWDLYPEENAILIGTQDMLLSRALNRGYGMSRYRWPMHFGLLNNDCMWVMDEAQLMGVGVETSAQLDGFRNLAQWSNDQNCPTWWMSATLDEDRFATVDHPKPAGGWDKIILSDTERTGDGVRERFEARKPVANSNLVLNADTKKVYAVQIAKLIGEKHQSGSLTLVVVNRVARAREIYTALKKLKSDSLNPNHIALIHSRFRPSDRTRHTKLLFGDGDRIVIATQAVEAGVDVSARILITELAPWSSLVQRFGRCNREGKIPAAETIWIDIQPKDDKDDLILPYSFDDLKKAGEELQKLRDAGPKSLSSVHVPETPVIRPVLRRRDLIDLFDTTPDLCGQDLDISRYIRDGEDSDVQFFWRNIGENTPTAKTTSLPHRDELCRVSIGDAHKFFDKQSTHAWQWNSLEGVWQKIERVRPGAVYLIDAASGGYDDDLGWTGEPKNKPTPCPPVDGDAESYQKDPQTFARYWLSLDQHTQHVVASVTMLAKALSFDPATTDTFRSAAQWHDVGKAHPAFQKMLRGDDATRLDILWAKSANINAICERSGFRHELASALAWLSAGPPNVAERDLIAYLIAAHHGKVRLSIRALPDEKGNPANPDGLYARGVWHDDKLPAVSGAVAQPVTLDLRLMQMGDGEHGPSWLTRMITLRDHLGPFRLAYLETLLRAADMRASREESECLAEADCAIRSQHAEKLKET